MPRCPHCRAPMSGRFIICETCGRVTSGSSGLQARISPSDGPSSGMAGHGGRRPSRKAIKGAAPGRRKQASAPPPPAEIQRRMALRQLSGDDAPRRLIVRKKEQRKAAFALVLVALVLFTPVQDPLVDGLEDSFGNLLDLVTPSTTHPLEASYTLRSTYEYEFGPSSSDSGFMYKLPIPQSERTAAGFSDILATKTDGGTISAPVLQRIVSMKVGSGAAVVDVPLTGGVVRDSSSAITLEDGYSQVFWPAPGGTGSEDCQYGRCLIWSGAIPQSSSIESALLNVEYEIESYSYTWWTEADLPSSVTGMTGGNGISKSTSGTFDDLDDIGIGFYTQNFGDAQFYDRLNGGGDYAIDGNDPIVQSVANNILASLSPDDQDNVFAFSHAAFIWVRDNVVYAQGLENPRSGPACLNAGIGDCDEQSNAWMSILRTKQVPTWYEMGVLGSGDFREWESHGWSNIALPLSDEACESRGINPTSCYVTAVVDVVNNKWLLYTPTVYSNFVQTWDHTGDDVNSVYMRISYDSNLRSFDVGYSVVGTPTTPEGTFTLGWIEGE
ncbi:MAG TPA: transglutaminase domain-containing protein [Candidatus Thalassarchaeaceae archaeon]|nr:transglutaminase domain-containing protein [Candidatus Thalassarchaeaceae archaeon]